MSVPCEAASEEENAKSRRIQQFRERWKGCAKEKEVGLAGPWLRCLRRSDSEKSGAASAAGVKYVWDLEIGGYERASDARAKSKRERNGRDAKQRELNKCLYSSSQHAKNQNIQISEMSNGAEYRTRSLAEKKTSQQE